MCGIAGIVGKADEGLIQAMTRVLAHRGPDGEGYYLEEGAALGHRRLSIIDLATGQQPMTTADGRYTIVFNGEIYNFLELRRELESRGVRFRTRSDTEVLLEAYARWGRDALAKLRGMFAFAIWDKRERRLFAVRDRLGVKPFYYAQIGSRFLFASEMKSLLVHTGFERKLNYAALDDYLTYLYVPPPQTIFQGIFELPPAHWLEWQDGRLGTARYWDVDFTAEKDTSQEVVKETQQVLEDAVRARLISDVPLGIFLSGGMDSSVVATLMARHLAEPVRAFTLKFQEGGHWYSESEFAREVSAAIGAESRELEIASKSAELLGTVTRHFDEPFGNPTSLLLYQLSEAARQHVTVALVGDAGDEVFLGYPRYQGAMLSSQYRSVPLFVRRVVAWGAEHIAETTDGDHLKRRAREFLTGSCYPPERMYLEWVRYFDQGLLNRLYSQELKRELAGHDPSQFLMELFAKTASADLIDRINFVDLHSFLPNNLLRYSDRMSMAHGLEIRSPFTDHKLIEFLARVPWWEKLRGNQTKYLLRRAARDWLPESILRRSKLGLNPPMGIWLRGHLRPLLDQYLSPGQIRSRGYFRPETVQELIRDFIGGRRDYSLHLWALISFEEWHRQYLDSIPRTQSAETVRSAHESSHTA
jgi:asparagine synthase (glutamine-hydrolysing)